MKVEHDDVNPVDRPRDPDPARLAAQVAVVVCSSCRDENGSDARPRPGEFLADDTRAAAAGSRVSVQTAECLGNCRRRLSAAIVCDGAWSYVFGDLNTGSGADLVAGANLLADAPDGLMPWRDRPASLKRGLVARIPPNVCQKANNSRKECLNDRC